MALWIINISGWIAGAEVLQLRQPSAVMSACAVSLPPEWHLAGVTEGRSSFPVAVSGYTFIPFLLQLCWGGQLALPGKHCDTTATKSLGLGRGKHPIALSLQQWEKRQNSIFTGILEVQLDFFFFFWAAGNNSSPCSFCIHLILERTFQQNRLSSNFFSNTGITCGHR